MDAPWKRSSDPGHRLAGRRALVTGAGCSRDFMGVGGAIATLFASQGAKVGIVDLSPERAKTTQSLIEEVGGEAVTAIGDVSDQADAARCVEEVAGALDGIDILVNSAAIVGAGGSPVSIDVATWDKVMAVNLTGAVLAAKYTIPHLLKAGGAIVNISSIAGSHGLGSGAYAASKAALVSLTRDWAYLHGRDGIRANCIVIGHAHTPMGSSGDESYRYRRLRAGLLRQEGDAWDVAWTAVFLASEEARWLTGVALTLDAGTTSTTPLGLEMLEDRAPMGRP